MSILYKLRIFRRLKVLEWKSEMLLQKIASVAHDPEAKAKMNELLKTMPKELRDD